MTHILICGNHPLFQDKLHTSTQKLGQITILPMFTLKDIASRMSQSPFVDMALLDCKALGKNIVQNTRLLCRVSPLTTVVVCTSSAEEHLQKELKTTGAYIIPKAAQEEKTLQIIEGILAQNIVEQTPPEPLNHILQ